MTTPAEGGTARGLHRDFEFKEARPACQRKSSLENLMFLEMEPTGAIFRPSAAAHSNEPQWNPSCSRSVHISRVRHGLRTHQLIELFLRQVAELERGLAKGQTFVVGLMSDFGGVV